MLNAVITTITTTNMIVWKAIRLGVDPNNCLLAGCITSTRSRLDTADAELELRVSVPIPSAIQGFNDSRISDSRIRDSGSVMSDEGFRAQMSRRTSVGSRRDARFAGSHPANAPMRASVAADAINVGGSPGSRP
jgi:hypothetical protein